MSKSCVIAFVVLTLVLSVQCRQRRVLKRAGSDYDSDEDDTFGDFGNDFDEYMDRDIDAKFSREDSVEYDEGFGNDKFFDESYFDNEKYFDDSDDVENSDSNENNYDDNGGDPDYYTGDYYGYPPSDNSNADYSEQESEGEPYSDDKGRENEVNDDERPVENYREEDSPADESENGGDPIIVYEDNDYESCEWSEWTNWEECTYKCGGGQQTRSRACLCDENADSEATCDSTEYGAEQYITCNVQPCLPCDKLLPVKSAGSVELCTMEMHVTSTSVFFDFTGTPLEQVSVYLDTYMPSQDIGELEWSYTVKFRQGYDRFSVTVPLTAIERPVDSYCDQMLYFIVKATTLEGGVGWAAGDYRYGYSSVIECYNTCILKDSDFNWNFTDYISDGVGGVVQLPDGTAENIQAGENIVGGSSEDTEMSSNLFSTLWLLYVILPVVAFVVAIVISAILLRKKFSEVDSPSEGSEEVKKDITPN